MIARQNPDLDRELTMEQLKPPMPVHVQDVTNFARLVLGLTEGSQMIWSFKHKSKNVLGFFSAYMYWDGDIPILAYTETDYEVTKPFLGYKSDSPKGEEWQFLDEADDSRFRYASIIDVKNLPSAFQKSLDGEFPDAPDPVMTELQDTKSLARVLLTLSMRDGNVFPLWHFRRGERHILGNCIPFEHYYDSDALPVFFYTTSNAPPTGPFLKYLAAKPFGEKLEFTNAAIDAKFFHAKIIDIVDFPLFPK